MVFMVRLTSGSLLLLLCIAHASNTTTPTSHIENQQTVSIERIKETESGPKNINKVKTRKLTDEDVENKVKPYKFSKTNPENATSLKLKKSESYTTTQQPTYPSSRLESGRSVDIDIEKFISPDFYNAVYTPPISTKLENDSHAQYNTERSSEHLGRLTTPSTPYFDKKYKELVDSVNQKLEVDSDIENITQPPNYTSDNFIEDLDKSPNSTKVVYKIFENIARNESGKASDGHRDVVLETQTIVSFERLHNETTIYDGKTPSEGINEVHKENIKYLIGEEHVNEVKKQEVTVNHLPSLRTSYQLTTKKYSFTKPSTEKNDAGIISNKIESDTLKFLGTTTTASTDLIQTTNSENRSTESGTPKGSMKFVDYKKESSSTIPTFEKVKVPEQVYQENQIIPLQVTSLSTNSPTTLTPSDPVYEPIEKTSTMQEAQETTTRNENISMRNNTVEPEEQQSTTVLIILQPTDPKKSSTESNFLEGRTVTIASTPRGFSLPVQSESIIPTTEMLTMTIENEESTISTEFEKGTTTEESTTIKNSDIVTDAKYTTAEVTYNDMTTFDIKTLKPTVTKSSFTKYTEMPITTETSSYKASTTPPTTSFSTIYQSSIAKNLVNTESTTVKYSTSFFNVDEITTSEFPDKVTMTLDQTTLSESTSPKGVIISEDSSLTTDKVTMTLDQITLSESSSSKGVNISEDSTLTIELLKGSTDETVLESATSVTTNDIISSKVDSMSTTPVLIETTTSGEDRATSPIESNTESSTMKTSISALTSDEKITTEPIPTTTFEQTTSSELRFSKGMKFTEESPIATEIMKDSTAETAVETTSIRSETLPNIDKKVTPPVSVDSTTVQETKTTIAPTEPPLEMATTKFTEATATEILADFTTTEKNTTQDDQLLFKLHPTTVLPTDSRTSNEPITTDDAGHSSELEGPNGTIVAIVISCVGGVCLIALACLLVVMRNRQNRFNYGQRCKPVSMDQYSVDSVSVFSSVRRKGVIRHSKRSYGNPAFEDPVCTTHPLNFPAISKFAANREDVEAEFGDIPQIVARTSELPEGCETKNRFANVIPLPESRVFLTPMAGYSNSDYINANYVTGPKNVRKYYIACQAPMSNTVDDFWRMIWEQQCKVILMLTNLYENGAERCFDYLPPSEVLDCHRLFGDYQITLKKREVKEKYVISSLQLKNMVSNSWREVTHFWYMGWPERGVPTEANSIIAFLIEARSYMKSATIDKNVILKPDVNGTCSPDVNPVVVHCSPGTGRTGTVITCDIAIRDFEQTRQVDIPKIVYRIRRDRASAVQTKEQYAFVYKVIALYATKLAGGSLESI